MNDDYIDDLYNQLGGADKFGVLEDFRRLISSDDSEDFSALVKKNESFQPTSEEEVTDSVTGTEMAPTGSSDSSVQVPILSSVSDVIEEQYESDVFKKQPQSFGVGGSQAFSKDIPPAPKPEDFGSDLIGQGMYKDELSEWQAKYAPEGLSSVGETQDKLSQEERALQQVEADKQEALSNLDSRSIFYKSKYEAVSSDFQKEIDKLQNNIEGTKGSIGDKEDIFSATNKYMASDDFKFEQDAITQERDEYLSAIPGQDNVNIDFLKEYDEDRAVEVMTDSYGKYGFTFKKTGMGDAMIVESETGDPLYVDLNVVNKTENARTKKDLEDYLWKNRNTQEDDISLPEGMEFTDIKKEAEDVKLIGNVFEQLRDGKQLDPSAVLTLMRDQPSAVSKEIYNQFLDQPSQRLVDIKTYQNKLFKEISVFDILEAQVGSLTEEEELKRQSLVDSYKKQQSILTETARLQNDINFAAGYGMKQNAIRNEQSGTTLGSLGNSILVGLENMGIGITDGYLGAEDWLDYMLSQGSHDLFEYLGVSLDSKKSIRASRKSFDKRSMSRKDKMEAVEKYIRGSLVDNLGSTTTEEYMNSEERTDVEKAAMGVLKSLPAMVTRVGGVPIGLFGQAYETVASEWMKNPDWKDMPLSDLFLVGGSIGVIQAALENYGLRTMFAKNALGRTFLSKVIKNVFKKSSAGMTKTAFEKLVAAETNSLLVNGAVRIVGGSLVEGETGFAQQVVDIGVKDFYNKTGS